MINAIMTFISNMYKYTMITDKPDRTIVDLIVE